MPGTRTAVRPANSDTPGPTAKLRNRGLENRTAPPASTDLTKSLPASRLAAYLGYAVGKYKKTHWYMVIFLTCIGVYDRTVTPEPSWNITNECHNLLARSLEPFRDVLQGFVLPSRHALTRYLSGYFDGFHSHVPFIHVPTFRLENCAPELFLAMFSVGAQYRFESNCGLYLFDAAKTISREQATRRRWKYRRTSGRSQMTALEEAQKRRSYMQTVSALLLLVAFATWQDDDEMLDEAIEFQSVIANCLRHQGFSESTSAGQVRDWRSWSLVESDRRVKLISFCYLTLHSITYNIPPALSSEEIDLRLPCSSAKWNARTATEWREAGGPEKAEPCFREALDGLLASTDNGKAAGTRDISPLGNLVVIHALLQRVFTIRQLTVAPGTSTTELFQQLEYVNPDIPRRLFPMPRPNNIDAPSTGGRQAGSAPPSPALTRRTPAGPSPSRRRPFSP